MTYRLALLAALAILTSASASAAPDGKNRKVMIKNLSGQTVRELYSSPITSKTWEEDLLAQKTLATNTSISANIDNGTTECYYDLMAVLADGRKIVRRKVNICAATEWVIEKDRDTMK